MGGDMGKLCWGKGRGRNSIFKVLVWKSQKIKNKRKWLFTVKQTNKRIRNKHQSYPALIVPQIPTMRHAWEDAWLWAFQTKNWTSSTLEGNFGN